MRTIGFFMQVVGLILLPSVFLWAVMNRIDSRTELTMLAVGAGLFYVGMLMSKRQGS